MIQITPQQIIKYCNIQTGWFDLDEAVRYLWLYAFSVLLQSSNLDGKGLRLCKHRLELEFLEAGAWRFWRLEPGALCEVAIR
jgi:hypothetical protein